MSATPTSMALFFPIRWITVQSIKYWKCVWGINRCKWRKRTFIKTAVQFHYGLFEYHRMPCVGYLEV